MREARALEAIAAELCGINHSLEILARQAMMGMSPEEVKRLKIQADALAAEMKQRRERLQAAIAATDNPPA